jgi:hypothetical protein
VVAEPRIVARTASLPEASVANIPEREIVASTKPGIYDLADEPKPVVSAVSREVEASTELK